LKSYGAAKREILPGVEHRQHKRLNNRVENAHQPLLLREKKMRRFKSAKHAQRFLSAFGLISQHFQPQRHRLRAEEYRATLQSRFQQWNEIIGVKLVSSWQNVPNPSSTSNIFLFIALQYTEFLSSYKHVDNTFFWAIGVLLSPYSCVMRRDHWSCSSFHFLYEVSPTGANSVRSSWADLIESVVA
jgi:hypothetical protein